MIYISYINFYEMRPRFNINGDLWYAMLDHVLLVSYDFSETNNVWTALARSYREADSELPFIVYKMDAADVFRESEKVPGKREPRVLQTYKKKYKIKPETRKHMIPRPPKLGDPIWHKGMTAGEYEAINGPRAIREHLTKAQFNANSKK